MEKKISEEKKSWWKNIGGTVSNWSSTSLNTCRQVLIATTGVVADWHAQLKLEDEQPELAEHRGIREEALDLTKKLSCVGHGHPKCSEMKAVGAATLLALVGSMPSGVAADDTAKTDRVAGALRSELARLDHCTPVRAAVQPE